MFLCENCFTTTKPGDGMTKVVTQTRRKEYRDFTGNVVGVGREIVREAKIGPCCREKITKA